jgi:NADH-quinone oxidoreductase subunit C
MTEDTNKPPVDDTASPDSDQTSDTKADEAPGTTADGENAGGMPSDPGAKSDKPKLSDEEKAAKIAAAKAKAAAAKAAKEQQEAEPKPPWEERPVPPEHAGAAEDPDVAALEAAVPGSVVEADRFAGDVTVTVPHTLITEVCRFLKDQQKFMFLVDLTAVDWPEREQGRFDVVYWMHRFEDSKRLRLRTVLPEQQAIPSVVGIWKTANWMEREAFDMFGILFEGHPGLERILTWEGFNGHPLRKDFPVEGIDTGAAIYPDVYPPGGGPVVEKEQPAEGGEEA